MAASLQDQIDALSNAIARGLKRWRGPDGAEVEYHSLEEMRAAKAALEAQLAAEVNGGFYAPAEFGRPS